MKPLQLLLAGLFAVCFSHTSFAQYEFIVPEYKLEAKEDYAKYEQDIVKAANWLESTPIGKEMEKRRRVNAFVVVWLTGSPSVSISVGKMSTDLSEKNPELFAMFMAGYARYVLENSYSKDELKANTAAVKSMISLYNLGGDVKKNKILQKAIEADKAGTLEAWVLEKMKKQ